MQPSFVHAANSKKTCKTHQIPVALGPGKPATYHVSGTLCSRGKLKGKTVQVLVHGFTLTHEYWDSAYQPDRYSYVNSLTKAGYVTLNLDRIGVGTSSHPLATEITVDSNAYVVHQVVTQLRAGKIGGNHFSKVMLVGHSLGTIISVFAARLGGVDGVVLSSFLHVFEPTNTAKLITSATPTQLDQKFKNEKLPVGYLTTRSGTRDLFYNQTDTDPNIQKWDEKTKGTGTAGEMATFGKFLLPTVAQEIHVPILLAIGEKDNLFCNDLLSCKNNSDVLQREQLFYSNKGTHLEAVVIKNAGHNLNYERNAHDFYDAVRKWSDRRINEHKEKPEPSLLESLKFWKYL